MNRMRFLTGLLRILSQVTSSITILFSAVVIYTILSGTGPTAGWERAAWLAAGAMGVVIGIWAIVGTAYYERFSESSKITKLMAVASAIMGALVIGLSRMLS